MTLYQKLRLFIDKHAIRGTKATWGLFILFAAVIFIKVIAFQWFVFHNIYISSLWKNPLAFWMFWLPKIWIALFLAFFTLISKRKYWTVILSLLIDVWIIANLIYFRANNYILIYDAIVMAGNLRGVEDSMFLYWNWQAVFFLVTTFIYGLLVPFLRPKQNKIGAMIIGVFIVVIHLTNAHLHKIDTWKKSKIQLDNICYAPFNTIYIGKTLMGGTPIQRASTHSIIDYFVTILVDKAFETSDSNYISLTAEDKEQCTLFCSSVDSTFLRPTHSLLFILVESLESFSLEVRDVHGNFILPHFRELLHQSNTLYCNHITSQAKHGVSADGQMIYNTGLLPIENGAAAMKYQYNTYPNYAHFYHTSALSNPWNVNGWNQHILTYSYGYQQHIASINESFSDVETFNSILTNIPLCADSLFCYFAITMDSHTPFDRIKPNPNLQLDVNMPEEMHKYLTCLHYTDSCFGVWYDEWKNTEQAKNTVLVITGDHTIFKDAMLQEFQPYAQQTGLSIASGKTYCPLIIQAPQIEENIQITDVCYQMDVYPTIMHLIGCEEYYWKGFGVNLLDSAARHNRPITEEQAYQLSDKLIRADYFRELQQLCSH